jgi:hypothetical protein
VFTIGEIDPEEISLSKDRHLRGVFTHERKRKLKFEVTDDLGLDEEL